ncbi:ribonuclease P protein component [Ornithinimicrobium sp. INDO-MA30-4]|uniref:ribonuclease P protein component n=1 Tax=Ornithinimicrobium sp. INDO-MA30-4 TaxID=2908651 RepID=UPI0021A3CD3F|nr:ribonuclease P protein component [Ornithinimicrobium sp. INDO-MA30-4]
MLPRYQRITRSGEFSAVLRGGRGVSRRAGGPLVVVHRRDFEATESSEPTRSPRVGFVVSKAVGNSVVRHRVTRQLRALMASRMESLPAGAGIVVRAQPDAASADFGHLSTELDRCLDKVAGE